MKADNLQQADNLVSILNAIVEDAGYDVGEDGFGYDPATLEISAVDEDFDDALSWCWDLIVEKHK